MKTYEVEVEVRKRKTFYVTASSRSDAEYEAYEKAQEIYDDEISIVSVEEELEPEKDIEKYRD
jgi:hypothetical protein